MARCRLTARGLFTPSTRTRSTDPETSRRAVEGVNVTLVQRRIIALLGRGAMFVASHGGTHPVIADAYRRVYGPTADSTIRTRVAELVDLGLVAAVGHTSRLNASARTFTIWKLTDKGEAVCRALP